MTTPMADGSDNGKRFCKLCSKTSTLQTFLNQNSDSKAVSTIQQLD